MMKVAIEENIITENFTLWLENEIVYLEFNIGTCLTQQLVIQLMKERQLLGQGYLFPIIVNMDNIKSTSHKSLRLFSNYLDATSSTCKAFIAYTLKGKILSRIIVNTTKSKLPSKNFHSVLNANNWVDGFQFNY